MSLNPTKPAPGTEIRVTSDERGNSYEVEQADTQSPMTAQFLALAAALRRAPYEILTGVAAPFRSTSWQAPSEDQKPANLLVGERFWAEAFALRRPMLVITCAPEAASQATKILGARFETNAPSGWGNTTLDRRRSEDGTVVVRLPHLSTYKLFSRPECIVAVHGILELNKRSLQKA
jgi:hypothetical protein